MAPVKNLTNDRLFNADPTIKDDVIAAAKHMVEEYPDIGAILLECSDMPPYAADIQAATQLPVFDFITLIKYMQNAVMQRPYCGWM